MILDFVISVNDGHWAMSSDKLSTLKIYDVWKVKNNLFTDKLGKEINLII